jgi:hypothetical protein
MICFNRYMIIMFTYINKHYTTYNLYIRKGYCVNNTPNGGVYLVIYAYICIY